MRVAAEQLDTQLNQHFSPIILLHGDEPLLIEEAADQVRQAAKKRGISEREVWHVEGRFDWSQIRFGDETLSLFSQQKLIEIRLPGAAPGKEGGELLRRFAESPVEDIYLLIISGKLAPAQQKSKWFTAIDKTGITVPFWPVTPAFLPKWIQQRLRSKGLHAQQSVAELIAERVEGNLFAAAQEIDKLTLLCADGQVDESTVLNSVANSARFEAFGLMDAVLNGQREKIPRMLATLQAEGTEVMAVFSAVSWTVQRWVDMAHQLASGQSSQQIFSQQRPPVWQKAQPQTLAILKKHSPQQWRQFIRKMAQIDQAAKGSGNDNPWRLLENLCLQLAGRSVVQHAS
jgi:DNA polymerase-3 subunit delta